MVSGAGWIGRRNDASAVVANHPKRAMERCTGAQGLGGAWRPGRAAGEAIVHTVFPETWLNVSPESFPDSKSSSRRVRSALIASSVRGGGLQALHRPFGGVGALRESQRERFLRHSEIRNRHANKLPPWQLVQVEPAGSAPATRGGGVGAIRGAGGPPIHP